MKYHVVIMAHGQGKIGEAKSEVVREMPVACADESAAREFIERKRWNGSPCCPHCGSVNVYVMTGRDGNREKNGRWRCKDCKKLYTVRTGTVMEDSRVPLRHWCYAFWRACTSKKGVSALEIQRQTGLSYKSSLFLLHRVRFAMTPADDRRPLTGIVEADETFVGGKPRHRRTNTTEPVYGAKNNYQNRADRHTPVFAAVERGGRCRAMVLPRVTSENVTQAVRDTVSIKARLMTDESACYIRVGKEQHGGHDSVCHGRMEYVRGDVTTNTVEGFFALLKRGLHGIYHNVSRKHLHRYVDEAAFRYNNRGLEDGQRVMKLLAESSGKRLTYRQSIA